MNQILHCDICMGTVPECDCTVLGDTMLCPTCLESETLICDNCGERIFTDDNAGDDNLTLCQRCYDRNFISCDRCGCTLHRDHAYHINDEDDLYCPDCYDYKCNEISIQDYYYKPEPVFHGDAPRFFGIELELDYGGECSDNAQEILSVGNRQNEHIYCKHDGSLDDGFEIVSHPMSYAYHLEEMPWQSVLQTAVDLGYQSHKTRTCGLHIHVSRSAFGETEAQQDDAIARVLYFFEKHWEELLKFSRRTQDQLNRWAARYGYKSQPKEILDHAKKGYYGSRYVCINLQPKDTIEFRVFRGTLKFNTFIATLQLVNKLCDVALSMSDEEMTALSWTSFVTSISEPELIQYLKERRLYVNEPVEAEGDL